MSQTTEKIFHDNGLEAQFFNNMITKNQFCVAGGHDLGIETRMCLKSTKEELLNRVIFLVSLPSRSLIYFWRSACAYLSYRQDSSSE